MGHVQLLDTTTIAVAQSSLPEVIVGHMYACILFAACILLFLKNVYNFQDKMHQQTNNRTYT